jgi:CheY-like chemotaxis protein/anti-sigma regulatory factor (Ser/Thr protein kinase)
VISNLLSNAAKYTPAGGQIEIAAGRDGQQIAIRVKDNGIGIPLELQSKVFDLFMQVDRSLERTQGGLGIGLTLVRRLVEMHGGTVEARSDGPGHGTEFMIRLPVPSEEAESGSVSKAQERATVANTPSHRVLVVDDNQDSAESLGMLMRVMGHEVRTAHDGFAALEAARQFRPTAVLLDIGLPGMNGYAVARELRQMPEAREAVLIAQTGWGQEDDRRRSTEAGFDAHLVKPVDSAALQQLLATLIKKHL